MNVCEISIIVPFYDKDSDLVGRMAGRLEPLSFDREIIFVDDREDKSTPIEVPGCAMVSYEGNRGLFEARRAGFNASHGKYIWFMDVDDFPLDITQNVIDDIYSTDYQVVCFNNYLDGKSSFRRIPDERYVKITPENRMHLYYKCFFRQVWCAIYSRDVIASVYKDVPYYPKFFMYEDIFLNALIFSRIDRVRTRTEYIYNYGYKEKSISGECVSSLMSKLKESEPKFDVKRYSEFIERIFNEWIALQKVNPEGS